MFVSSPIKWRKVCLIKWREISLDMQKPFLLKIQISIFIHVFFLSQAYLSPKHRRSLELAWFTCGTSGFCNNQSRGNCAWFAVLCVTHQNRMP